MKLRSLRFLLSALPAVCMAALLLASPALAAVGSDGSSDVILTVPVVPEGPPDVNLVIDDGGGENSIGDNGQFIWINRFTPAPAQFPFAMTEVQAVFGMTMVTVGGAVDIVFHEDTDGDNDPGTGAVFRGVTAGTVQAADNATFSVYPINPPLAFCGPGDVLIGVINRYGSEGFNDFPARLDQTASQGRSWAASYLAGDAPAQPFYPADEQWGTIDSFGFPGNWIVRGFGSTTALEADLSLSKTAAVAGNQIIYTLTVRDTGSACGATNVTVTDTLPADVTYVSDDCGGANGPPWVWNVGTLGSGASATCNITVDINPDAVLPITNTATVTATQTDNVPDNDTAVAIVGNANTLEIPTLGSIGLALLLVLLAATALFLLRRRRA
ncbi:MAG: DUF11 domain-containing protein [Acidobacteria bacterium]|nr:DUF11 domain-containing protein [Acidobacteriota bacterium]